MATGNEYRQFILDQLADVPGIRLRPMMGEYLLYVQEKLVGGLYDDRWKKWTTGRFWRS